MQEHSLTGLVVSAAEDGMKLLRFLERRLAGDPGASLLHKWIRTGQVRVNKGRAKPFTLLREGDMVRLPPFARTRDLAVPPPPAPPSGPDLAVVASTAHFLVLAKPAGLPVQAGSGHADSVADRLRAAHAGQAFIPAPAHRLDRHTSGLLLVGTTHRGLQELHARFASPGAIAKAYLAWVTGRWAEVRPCLLLDVLEKIRDADGREGMRARPGGKTIPLPAPPHADPQGGDALEGTARAVVQAVRHAHIPRTALHAAGMEDPQASPEMPALWPHRKHDGPPMEATLLLVRLLTGRTHQIRVQFASRGFPIIGDGRYHGPLFRPMLLHAYSLSLAPIIGTDGIPEAGRQGEPSLSYRLLPDWPAPFMPDDGEIDAARAILENAL